ncbi:MAG: histidine kinase [Leptospiraceae bacterium]|nr:histidine kinase [Leptospiraceae bacterium]MCP5501046.1 histidine kinase [Leptospiraceae bacterium]
MYEENTIKQELEISEFSNNSLSIRTFKMSSDVEVILRTKMEEILDGYNKSSMLATLYTIIKELSINACKANQKRVFFEERGMDITDEDIYASGMKDYKKILNEENLDEYGDKCKRSGYYCLVTFSHNSDGMTVVVENNTPIAYQEERAIREKLSKAMRYDDIALFFVDNADNTEGAGLGLALIVIMLKGEGIDPRFFRIFTSEDITLARLEIPFTDRFKSIRYQ